MDTLKIEITTEARLRKGFADVVKEVERDKVEDDKLFRLIVVAAAGVLICTLLKSLGVSKETMSKIMIATWEDQDKPAEQKGKTSN